MNKFKIIILSVLVVFLVGCARTNTLDGDVYRVDQVKGMREIQYGKIVSVRTIKIQADSDNQQGSLGGLLGAGLGGIAGGHVGGGWGSVAAALIGAGAGALAGDKASEYGNAVDASELVINLDKTKKDVVVVQKYNAAFQKGKKVRIVGSGDDVNVSVL